jgi:hypothetical protein
MTATLRETEIVCTLGGQDIPLVTSVTWSTGYDLQVGEATINTPLRPGFGSYFDPVSISVNGTTRWSGLLVPTDYALFPRNVGLVCRDPLVLAQRFTPPESLESGLYLEDLTGGPASDQDIVTAALNYGGLGGYIGGIGGTGTIMGSVAPEEFVWKPEETLMMYIKRIDAISLGYRTFWDGGSIVRLQISSRPSGSPDYTFTEGVDISGGNTRRSPEEAYSAVRVSGYAVGDYADPRVFYIQEDNLPWESRPRVLNNPSNPMIERRADSSPGLGMSCESVANYLLGELNRELVSLTMSTPRDELFLPGQIHLVQGPGGSADRLHVGELLWVQRVDGRVGNDGGVGHTLAYVGGGA